jgi:hypothetical protein
MASALIGNVVTPRTFGVVRFVVFGNFLPGAFLVYFGLIPCRVLPHKAAHRTPCTVSPYLRWPNP